MKVYEKLITQDKVDLDLTPWGTTIHSAAAVMYVQDLFPKQLLKVEGFL